MLDRRSFLNLGLAAAAPASRRANIVLILADDMGFSDLSCYGSEIETPNLDALASRGVRFTHFYNTARCCPSRASLLTGLYSHQAGVGHMLEDRKLPGYRGRLNPDCKTIAEVLVVAGYRSTMAGKWHVANDTPAQRDTWPMQRGFSRYYGAMAGGVNYFKPGPIYEDNQRTGLAEGFYTDLLGDASIRFINESVAAQKPFFHYTAFTAPHWPLHAPADDIKRFEDIYKVGWDEIRARRYRRQLDLGILSSRWPLSPRDSVAPPWPTAPNQDWQASRMAAHAAMVYRLDLNVGRIVEAVRKAGQIDNTLFLFLSDNGASNESIARRRADVWAPEGSPPGGNIVGAAPGPSTTYSSFGPDWAHVSNTPFRLHKQWVHEGGISTPLIASWGNQLKPNRLDHTPGHLIDLMPTCAEAAGLAPPSFCEGRSLIPNLKGRPNQSPRDLFWEHQGNRAIRSGNFKLVAQHKGPWELYDLAADRTELNNLAEKQLRRVTDLTRRYEAWMKSCHVEPWATLPKP
ncbi:MAG: arylsulfatase [Acidobacteria bacterium]|nr:arylsulfatase [Acidobacteriota bacterium]